MATLTKRQKQLVDFLENYITEHGYAPTLSEVGQYFGLSSLATVHKHLHNLEQKGFIKRQHNHSRALEVSGGFGMFKKSEMERLFRDARAGRFHPANSSLAHELIGKLALGINPDDPQRWG